MIVPRKVYAIQHNVTKKIYVGSSRNVDNRYKAHIGYLRRGTHPIEDMQFDYDQFGEDYSVFILDEIATFGQRTKEQEWMRKLKSYIRSKGYNYKDPSFKESIISVPHKKGIPETID